MAYEPPPLDRDKRPFDFLNERKGKQIRVTFNNDSGSVGNLLAFDIHLNVWLETIHGPKLIRGGAIKLIEDCI